MTDLDPFGNAAVFTPQAQAQAAPDPFGAAPMVGDMPAAEPPKAGEGDQRRYRGVVDALSQNLGAWGRSALDTVVNAVPGAFERSDGKTADPLADTPFVTQDGKLKWRDPNAPHTALGRVMQQAPTAGESLNNLRTGIQRAVGADAGAPQSAADFVQRSVYNGAQALYNIVPPLRMDAGPLLRTIGNPYALYRYHVQGDKSPMMLGPFSAGMGGNWLWNNWDGHGPTPDNWTTPYDQSSFKYQNNVGYRGPVDVPSLDFGKLSQSPDAGETGWASGLTDAGGATQGQPPTPDVKTPALHLDKATINLPDIPQGMTKADDFMTWAGKRANDLSQSFGGPKIDLSPYNPTTGAGQVAQELMSGFFAPGPLLLRMAMPAASALIGQIPGIKDTKYELPARIVAGLGVGVRNTAKAGQVTDAGKVLRQNTEDIGRSGLEALERQQKDMTASGLTVLPAEVASLGRGDEPALVKLTQQVAGTRQGGPGIRKVLQTRAQDTQGVTQEALDSVLGQAPGDKTALSSGLADAGQAHVQTAAAMADQARVALAGIKGTVGPEGVQGVIRSLDRALLGDREGFTTRTLQDLRGGLAQPARPLRAVGADVVGSPRVVEPVTDLRTLHKLTTEWERRLAAGEVPDAARPAVEKALGDLRTHMKVANPAYAAASLNAGVAAEDAAHAAASPVGRIGKAAELEGATPNSALKSAHSLLLDPANATPESLGKAAAALNARDPSLFRGLVSDWLNSALSKAYGQGVNPETGAAFARSVFGNPQQKKLLQAALENVRDDAGNPVSGEQLLKLFPGLEAQGMLPNLGKAPATMSLRPAPGLLSTVASGFARKIPGLGDAMQRRSLTKEGKAAADLAGTLGSGQGVSRMLDLMYRVPEARRREIGVASLMNEGRNIGRSIMFGTGGGLPSPLLNPDDQQKR